MSSASYASIAGLTVMENPRSTTTKGVVFDGNFYVGTESCQSLLVLLRYFNGSGMEFSSTPTLYFVYATIAQMDVNRELNTSKINLYQSDLEPADYSLVGDIQIIIPLGSPADLGIDPRQRAYVHLCGAVFNPNGDTATFSLDADQYTASFRETQKEAKDKHQPVPRSYFPADCIIPDSPRYANTKKPVPFNKRFVMLTGYITGVTSTLEKTVKERFCIDVDNIAFLGSQTAPAISGSAGASSPASFSSTSVITTVGRKRWSYDTQTPVNNGKRRKTETSPEPAGSSSPVASGSSPSPLNPNP
ncbi:hypothetical protein B0H17DRAFT_1149254 [Mycena rosella]|uniref:Uncharacterized protein n=1 Tax=Mycena rosella TaxID=1033263 RepID=A0AAD7C3C8_MYCRO|nr:hypothetical protein B0H17DRAFT_1149254 [Mycena rosella]